MDQLYVQNGSLKKSSMMANGSPHTRLSMLKHSYGTTPSNTIHKHGRPISISELAEALPMKKSKADSLSRLMRMLTNSGFFLKSKIVSETEEQVEAEGYSLSLAGRMLIKDDPCSMSKYVLALLDPITTDPFHQLCNWFKNDLTTPFETTHGKALWDCGDGHESHLVVAAHNFNAIMATDSLFVSGLIVNDDCRHIFEG
ncbi:hypothetical protein Leryth_003288 [Lithospermum erythrorhizon]|nr:hypothetical protein Leryth_003288 [Lithospermum erythrorhizon]